MSMLSVATLVFLLNLPFGYFRANEEKLSKRWFLAIHLPVPFVIALRILSGLGWQFITFPVMIGAFFGGQLAGGWFLQFRKQHAAARVSSCMVWDLVAPGQRRS